MPKVTLKKGCGKHRLADGTYCKPGQETELTEAQLANIGDKFEVVASAAELMVMAEKKAEDEASAAKLAKERATAAAAKAAELKKDSDKGSQGKG